MKIDLDELSLSCERMNGQPEAVNSGDFEPIPICPEITRLSEDVVRIPCRARGVCDSHTPTSAYLEIPRDCLHGRLLKCSHEKCRDSGRVFRYCKICNQVTAKRNFSKRHAHGVYDPSTISTVKNSEPKKCNNKKRDQSLGASTENGESDSTGSKKRKVTYDNHEALRGDSFVSLIMNAMGEDGYSTDDEAISTEVPTTVFKNKNESKVLVMMSQAEAALFEIVRSRPSARSRSATEQWLKSIVSATDYQISDNEMLTDDEELVELKEAPRAPSLDRFDVFAQSFESLFME